MDTLKTEVLVVGSGFGAAAPSLRLSTAGFQVVMIEKGPEIVPERDFEQTQDPQYLLRYIKSVRGDNVNFTYAEGLGGGSGFYEMVSLRAPSIAFDQKGKDGGRLWPAGITRSAMDPYYTLAETMMHVCQIGKEEIPKSGLAFSYLLSRLGYTVDRVPYSVQGCRGNSYCVAGCTAGAKVTLHHTYLEPAIRAGMTIMTGCEAREIHPLEVQSFDEHSNRNIQRLPYRYDVHCFNSKTSTPVRIQAKLLILGGGTVGTAALLLRSRRWLPDLGSHLGKNIAVNGTVKSLGILPEGFPEGDMFTGRSHPGIISYEFLKTRGITISTAKPLPVDAVSYANFIFEGETRSPATWGEAKVEVMKLYRRRAIVLYALGLSTPTAELHLSRRGDTVPSFELDGEFREYYHSTLDLLHSIFRRNNGRVVNIRIIDGQGVEYPDLHITTAHMTGSCRMADSPSTGVANATGEVFHYPGLYIADGSAIPSSLAVNPYLTILANAERVGEWLSRWYSRGEVAIKIDLKPAKERYSV
jgi:choline dehydrogenase-like flavoprotein